MAADPPRAAGERILVVDDEPDIVALVAYHLARAGYRVSTAGTGLDALRAAKDEAPVLVVLDLMLPGMSGFEVLDALRADESTAGVAVLLLTAHKAEEDRIRGLSLGADDYVTKPFSPQELVLRVGAILRRTRMAPTPTDRIVVGPLSIDRTTHEVSVDGEVLDLTPTEYKLLVALARKQGRVLPRTQLLEQVWEAAPDMQTRTVDMHVLRLRSKLGDAANLIETIRGFGYRIRGEVGPSAETTGRRNG
jgi:two-component system phosphate regulon response regulator PhoB